MNKNAQLKPSLFEEIFVAVQTETNRNTYISIFYLKISGYKFLMCNLLAYKDAD